jgi:hypothetical protein
MSTLSILLPSLAKLAGQDSPALRRWLARGDRLADAPGGRTAMLREVFQIPGSALPAAALTRQMDVHDAGNELWLRADPTYVRADMAAARMLACGNMQLSNFECQQLIAPLKPLFGDAGFVLDAPTTQRWYLRGHSMAQLPVFSAPDEVLGDDLSRHLPPGDGGKRWRALLNEAQVILHNHPLNQARIERGRLPCNSLWFWGAGKLPAWVKSSLVSVVSEDPLVHALAQHAGLPVAAPNASVSPAAPLPALLDLTDAVDPKLLERDWFAAIDRRLHSKRGIDLRLLFSSGERYRIARGHRWRLWRRVPGPT